MDIRDKQSFYNYPHLHFPTSTKTYLEACEGTCLLNTHEQKQKNDIVNDKENVIVLPRVLIYVQSKNTDLLITLLLLTVNKFLAVIM